VKHQARNTKQKGKVASSNHIATLRKELPILHAKYGIVTMWLFGSYVHGRNSKRSDLDVLVEFDNRPMSLFDFIEIQQYLSSLLRIKVDLVEKNALKPNIAKNIFAEMIKI